MNVDPEGHFPVLAVILGLVALAGLGTTVAGVALDNNIVTAIGLTAISVPALISGGIAIAAGIGGATLAGIIGGVTMGAGLGSGLFASAEYQEAFTGNNWILNTGISEGWYNGLLLATALVATLGTLASSITGSLRMRSITEIGSLTGTKYKGIRFTQVTKSGKTRVRTLEWHTHLHNGYKHWQINKWDNFIRKGVVGRWKWWLGKL